MFKLTPEEKNDIPENNRKRDEIPPDCKVTEDHKTKENKPLLKERRNTRDETDTWAYIAAEGDQEVLDGVSRAEESPGECVSLCAVFSGLCAELSPHLPLLSAVMVSGWS